MTLWGLIFIFHLTISNTIWIAERLAFAPQSISMPRIHGSSPTEAMGTICDPLSQNEHKVANFALWNYCRFKFFTMQALKWYMICECSFLFCPAKINILCWFSFVFCCFVTFLTGFNWRLYAHFVVAGHIFLFVMHCESWAALISTPNVSVFFLSGKQANVGQDDDFDKIREKAIKCGALKVSWSDIFYICVCYFCIVSRWCCSLNFNFNFKISITKTISQHLELHRYTIIFD